MDLSREAVNELVITEQGSLISTLSQALAEANSSIRNKDRQLELANKEIEQLTRKLNKQSAKNIPDYPGPSISNGHPDVILKQYTNSMPFATE